MIRSETERDGQTNRQSETEIYRRYQSTGLSDLERLLFDLI